MSRPLRIWTAERLIVCLPSDVADPMVQRLRDVLAGDPTVDDVLELLAADGLAATPSFVCAAAEHDGARVVVRGDVEATAHGLDGSPVGLTAGRSSTWNDDVVADIASISIDLGAGGSTFEWFASPARPTATAEAEPLPKPEPKPEPEPEPEPLPKSESDSDERADAGPVPASTPEPQTATPVESDDPHTLDEQAFQQIRAADPAAVPVPTSSAPAPPAPAPPQPPRPAGGLDFSQLLDDTSHRLPPPPRPMPTIPTPAAEAPTALVEPPSSPAPPAPESDRIAPGAGTGLGEQDGRTITLADLQRIREADEPGESTLPARQVRATRCPAGHANPSTAGTCRRCGAEITDQTVVTVPRPVLARLVFDSGLVVDLDRPQLIGRRPTAPTDADEIPNLVTVPSPDGDISRGHTAVRLEGWDILVEDVGSTNGTEVRLPGGDPVRLREHAPALTTIGTEVTLAGTVRFTIQAPE